MAELAKETQIRWVKHGNQSPVLLMGKDVVVLASERFVQFIETSRPDKKEILYNADNEVRGDGIDCICTHPGLPCFAFSEKCRNPRIMVLLYPSFENLKTFDSVTDTNYIQLRFSEMEFLVALTGVPDFKLVIWNWRTGEKLYVQETKMHGSKQIIRISPLSPLQIIQSTGVDNRLIFWNMNLCYKKTLLNSSSILLPKSSVPPYCFTFGADGDVYFVDFEGSLYSINPETRACIRQYTYIGAPATDFIPCVTWYKGGIVFTTPTEVLVLRRKSPEGWTKISSLVVKFPFRSIMASTVRDLLVGVNITNDILILKTEPQFECLPVRNFGADFEFVTFVYPDGDYFVTFGNMTKKLTAWEAITGKKVSQIPWTKGKINALKSNPRFSYLVVATAKGWVHLVNAYDPANLAEFESLYLTENSLDEIRFRLQGSQFCVANKDIGEFFLLKVPAKMDVVAHIKLDLKIVDFAIFDKPVHGGILAVVPMSQFCCRSGHTVLLYGLEEKQKEFFHVKDIVLPTIVTKIIHTPTPSRNILCIPHRSRKIISVELPNGKISREFVTGHQMKFMSLQIDDNHLFTFGPDGLVIVRMVDTKTCVTLFYSHHRLAKGIVALAVNSYKGVALALGENGDLVCVFVKKLENLERRAELEAWKSSAAFRNILSSAVKARALEKQEQEWQEMIAAKSTWLSNRVEELVSMEQQQSQKERRNILEEFYRIKDQVGLLLDENLSNEPEKHLPIQAFDLDKAARRKKLEDAKAEREKEKQLRMANVKILTKLAEVIKTNCWDSVAVKGREIQSILTPITVQSYALFAESKSFDTEMIWLTEAMKMIQLFRVGDFFDPWTPRTESDLELHISSKFKIEPLNVMQTIRTKYETEQTEEDKTKEESDLESFKLVWSGTSTHNFIEVDPNHYTQFELKTFLQSHQEVQFIQADIRRLMQWFNKEFVATFECKEQELQFVQERNDRLRHIIKELSFFNFSPYLCKTQIHDPCWAPEENPETIMTVKDEEVKAAKYISESMMELIKEKEAEEERLRQLLRADDFKEKALMMMMDGVLEKLWEDEIKKDPPKPKCMLENKDPGSWTEEDIKAMKIYEESMRFLNIERERYRKILEARWVSTIQTIKDSVAKFDEKVAKLHVLKLKVEAAIGQEILMALRIQKTCFDSIELQRRKEALKASIGKNEKKIETMSVELSKLQEMLVDCKAAYESLQNKDRNLDKNFRKEFPDFSPIICEQLYKASKKRPKLIQKSAIYPTVLNDLGKCAVTGAKPDYMPTECIQYLKELDALDAYSNAPASINQQSWETACKLRRTKIDTELKIRACAIDVADAEATVAAFHKDLKAAKEEQTRLQNDLQTVWAEKTNNSFNFPIQLVLKRGLVEIPLTGDMSDFNESVLVTKDTLKEVNKAIQKMGQQKIKAMEKAANFRKGIIYKEWEHKKLRMEIEDLKGQLQTIEKLQVLKELQAILVARARGFSDEKGFLYLENELAKVKQKYEKEQTELYKKVDEFDSKIAEIKQKNEELDLKIFDVNVEVNEMNLSRDMEFDKKYHEENMRRMRKIRERGKLVRKIQDQHNEILLLQTELELLRLKTYPTIKYKIS